ncbi:MAG TPA: DoxX family protein [Pyrinomonadaceae bacterium]|nr:DoxX family protein [Pyrinomonadaceae bacterium]
MFRRLIATSATWIPLPLRLATGVIFMAHGAQKVFGSFQGPGFKNFTAIPAPFGFMKPAWLWLAAAALSELVGGLMIFLGLLTRLGAFLIACTMLTAIAAVHWPNFFAPKGMELPLSLLATMLALMISGGGMASIDRAITGGRRR